MRLEIQHLILCGAYCAHEIEPCDSLCHRVPPCLGIVMSAVIGSHAVQVNIYNGYGCTGTTGTLKLNNGDCLAIFGASATVSCSDATANSVWTVDASNIGVTDCSGLVTPVGGIGTVCSAVSIAQAGMFSIVVDCSVAGPPTSSSAPSTTVIIVSVVASVICAIIIIAGVVGRCSRRTPASDVTSQKAYQEVRDQPNSQPSSCRLAFKSFRRVRSIVFLTHLVLLLRCVCLRAANVATSVSTQPYSVRSAATSFSSHVLVRARQHRPPDAHGRSCSLCHSHLLFSFSLSFGVPTNQTTLIARCKQTARHDELTVTSTNCTRPLSLSLSAFPPLKRPKY
jgi:hypothetical protein